MFLKLLSFSIQIDPLLLQFYLLLHQLRQNPFKMQNVSRRLGCFSKIHFKKLETYSTRNGTHRSYHQTGTSKHHLGRRVPFLVRKSEKKSIYSQKPKAVLPTFTIFIPIRLLSKLGKKQLVTLKRKGLSDGHRISSLSKCSLLNCQKYPHNISRTRHLIGGYLSFDQICQKGGLKAVSPILILLFLTDTPFCSKK